jgi:WD40 repeat protein
MSTEIKCPECGSIKTMPVPDSAAYLCYACRHEFTPAQTLTPLRIFLSYGHDSNEELVRLIKAELEKRGHDVWFDKDEIKFSDNWRREITEGIVKSHRVLSFLSKYSTRDPGVCRDEIAIAIGVKGGNIQTILVESEQEVEPPVNIGHIQWLDMHNWKEKREAGPAAWEPWYQTRLAEIIQVVESDESRRFAGEIETLNSHLRPINSDARIGQLLSKGFYGRQWLFSAVESWRLDANQDSRLFWIMGAPGVGKSAFAAHLTHTRGDIVVAAQFCEWDKPDHRDARRVICSIACQLATRLPDYRKLLLTLPEIGKLDRKDAAELFEYLLSNPLQQSIKGGRDRYLIVIDALDEAGEDGRNPLVELLAGNAQRLPTWLGLVVTSRPEFDVRSSFQALNPFPLDTQSESNHSDIFDYLRRELAVQLKDRPDADGLMRQILARSEGVFLYVERFCDDIRRGLLSLDRPGQFPQGLGGIFDQYFKRQFPDLEKFRTVVRPALRVIIAARQPLPVEILRSLLHWQEEEFHDFTRPLASLFPVITEAGREVIKPYHKSLPDWLADQARAGDYFVSSADGHRALADFGWREYLERVEGMSGYSVAHLPAHLRVTGREEDLRKLLVDLSFLALKSDTLGPSSLLNDFAAGGTLDPDAFPWNDWNTFVLREHHKLAAYTIHGYGGFLQQVANKGLTPAMRAEAVERLAAACVPWARHDNPDIGITILSISPVEADTAEFLRGPRLALATLRDWKTSFEPAIERLLEEWRPRFQPDSYGETKPSFVASHSPVEIVFSGRYSQTLALVNTSTCQIDDLASIFRYPAQFPACKNMCYDLSRDGTCLAAGTSNTWYGKAVEARMGLFFKTGDPWVEILSLRPGTLHPDQCGACAFNSTGTLCAFGLCLKEVAVVRIVDVQSRRICAEIPIPNSYAQTVDTLSWRPATGELLVRCSNNLFLLDPQSSRFRLITSKASDYGRHVFTFDGQGEILALTGKGSVDLYDIASGKLTCSIPRVADVVSFLDDDAHLALWDQATKVLSVVSLTLAREQADAAAQALVIRHKSAVNSVGFCPGRRLLAASSGRDGDFALSLTDLDHPSQLQHDGMHFEKWIDSTRMLIKKLDCLHIVDLQFKDAPPPITIPENHEVADAAVHPGTGALVTSGDDDGSVRIWELQPGGWKESYRLHAHMDPRELSFSPDGACLAAAGGGQGSSTGSGHVAIWDLRAPEVIFLRKGGGTSVHFFRRRPWLFMGPTGSTSDAFEIFDLKKKKSRMVQLNGHRPVFSPQDSFVAVVKSDAVLVYDCREFKLQVVFVAEQQIGSVAWSDDGCVAVGCDNGKVEILTVLNLPAGDDSRDGSVNYVNAILNLGFQLDSRALPPLCYGPPGCPERVWYVCLNLQESYMDREFICLRCGYKESFPHPRYTSCPACGNA